MTPIRSATGVSARSYLIAFIALALFFGGDGLAGPASFSIQKIDVGAFPRKVIPAAGSMWVIHRTDGTVGKINPDSNLMTDTFSIAPRRFKGWRDDVIDLESKDGRLWVAVSNRRIYEVDSETGKRLGNFKSEGHVYGLFFGGGSLWYVDGGMNDASSETLIRVDPADYEIQASIRMRGQNAGVSGLETFDGSIWVLRDNAKYIGGQRQATWRVSAHLWEVDLSTNEVASKTALGSTLAKGPVDPVVGEMEEANGSLWFTRVYERRVLEMNPHSGRVLKVISLPDFELAWEITKAEGYLWVGNLNHSDLARIDPESGQKLIGDVRRSTSGLSGGFGSVWFPRAAPRDPWEGTGHVFRVDS